MTKNKRKRVAFFGQLTYSKSTKTIKELTAQNQSAGGERKKKDNN